MSKLKPEQLHSLILSLSKGEKRFFKLYASRLNNSSEKKFMLLFDAIEKHKIYDEQVILSKNKSLNPKQLPNLKAHLYYQLLKAIKLCNSDKQENIRITELLDYARILYNKCLYKEAVKMIDKAKREAIENDCSLLLLEVLELEKLVIPKTVESGNELRVNELIATTNTVAKSIQNINVFSNLSLKLNSFYVQTGFSRTKEDLEKVTYFFLSSLPKFDKNKLSFQEKLHLYNSYIGYYFYIQNFKKGLFYSQKLVALFDEHPEMKQHKLEFYIKALNSLLVVQNKLYKYNDFVLVLKQLTQIKRDKKFILTDNIKLNLFKAIYVHEINRHFMLGEFSSGTRIVVALEDELNKFILKLDKHSILLFYYKISCLYIGSGDFKTAIKWLNKIYNEKEINFREDIYSFTRILLLVCHFELNNENILESHIRSTYRYFTKKGELSKYQKNIFHFLQSLFLNPSEINLKKQFVLLKSNMLILENKQYEKRAFMYFDIISWLESKIERESIESIIKIKAAKKILEN
jgi:hypothetical protein